MRLPATLGFTSCPDVCPTTLHELAQLEKLDDDPSNVSCD